MSLNQGDEVIFSVAVESEGIPAGSKGHVVSAFEAAWTPSEFAANESEKVAVRIFGKVLFFPIEIFEGQNANIGNTDTGSSVGEANGSATGSSAGTGESGAASNVDGSAAAQNENNQPKAGVNIGQLKVWLDQINAEAGSASPSLANIQSTVNVIKGYLVNFEI